MSTHNICFCGEIRKKKSALSVAVKSMKAFEPNLTVDEGDEITKWFAYVLILLFII